MHCFSVPCSLSLRSRASSFESTQVERSRLPTLGKMIADQTKLIAVDEADKMVDRSYKTTLY